jgi:hypothetical protein
LAVVSFFDFGATTFTAGVLDETIRLFSSFFVAQKSLHVPRMHSLIIMTAARWICILISVTRCIITDGFISTYFLAADDESPHVDFTLD